MEIHYVTKNEIKTFIIRRAFWNKKFSIIEIDHKFQQVDLVSIINVDSDNYLKNIMNNERKKIKLEVEEVRITKTIFDRFKIKIDKSYLDIFTELDQSRYNEENEIFILEQEHTDEDSIDALIEINKQNYCLCIHKSDNSGHSLYSSNLIEVLEDYLNFCLHF